MLSSFIIPHWLPPLWVVHFRVNLTGMCITGAQVALLACTRRDICSSPGHEFTCLPADNDHYFN